MNRNSEDWVLDPKLNLWGEKEEKEIEREVQYMLTTWQEELSLKEQSQTTELSDPFISSEVFQCPFPLHGSTPKSQSFFPNFFPISFNAFTAQYNTNHQKHKNMKSKLQQLIKVKATIQKTNYVLLPFFLKH